MRPLPSGGRTSRNTDHADRESHRIRTWGAFLRHPPSLAMKGHRNDHDGRDRDVAEELARQRRKGERQRAAWKKERRARRRKRRRSRYGK